MDTGGKWHVENVDSAHFYTNKDIDKLIADTEATFINKLENGDRQKAMKRLRVPPLGEQRSPWTTFKVGLFSGSFIVLLIAVVLSGFIYVVFIKIIFLIFHFLLQQFFTKDQAKI